jgi:hypothetical protein
MFRQIFLEIPLTTGNKFLYVLEQFKEQPDLKVNITDPKQQLVPLFTGISIIASEHEDYWFYTSECLIGNAWKYIRY